MMKLKRFCRRNSSKVNCNGGGSRGDSSGKSCGGLEEIKWEVRPGGLLVQKRNNGNSSGEEMITIRVSTVTQLHDISIEPTSTIGELKMMLEVVTGLKAREQRILYRGKERENEEFLHMVGVRHMEKVLLLEDPAIKERKLHASISRKKQTLTLPLTLRAHLPLSSVI